MLEIACRFKSGLRYHLPSLFRPNGLFSTLDPRKKLNRPESVGDSFFLVMRLLRLTRFVDQTAFHIPQVGYHQWGEVVAGC